MSVDHVTIAPRRVQVGLIGCGISRSRTPAMHMAEAEAQGFACDYKLLDMDDPSMSGLSLPILLDKVESEGYAGVNVTFPYKIEVMDLMDELSDNARAVGAVNTVILKDGKRIGHNTDLWGFAQSFRRGLGDAVLDHVLLIGAGGAGGAVAHAAAQSGVKQLTIHDTDLGRAKTLAEQINANWPDTSAQGCTDLEQLFATARPDGVINATPMGMAKLPGSALPEAYLDPSMWVADIVYFPLETQLLKSAREHNCRVLPGSGMAVYQAVRAFELFTGQSADPNRMKARFDAFD